MGCSSGSPQISAGDDCDVVDQHEMTYAWKMEPDPNSPLKVAMTVVECTFDGNKCSDLLQGLQSSGDSTKEEAKKAGIAALTLAVAHKQGGTEMVKKAASSSGP